jgi:hypothetical protein
MWGLAKDKKRDRLLIATAGDTGNRQCLHRKRKISVISLISSYQQSSVPPKKVVNTELEQYRNKQEIHIQTIQQSNSQRSGRGRLWWKKQTHRDQAGEDCGGIA